MVMKSRLIGIVFLLMITFYAHAAQNAAAEGDNKNQNKVVVIEMQGYHFKPDKITIEPGTTVEWNNTGEIAHTVTDEHDAWDSGSLKPGEKFSRRFDESGTFEYYCIPHREAQMTGTIIVK